MRRRKNILLLNENAPDLLLRIDRGHRCFYAQEQFTIVPDARLFGFPFALTNKDGGFSGENLRISVAPSMPWLIAARSKGWSGEFEIKAWLGSPRSTDYAIHLLRNRLEPALNANKVEIIEENSPTGLEHKAVVIVVSHGGVGLFNHFRTVTDHAKVYSGKEFASHFEECGCVVLFVCNAGRSDIRTGSTETMGLVADLLRNGARCVIAPPWPLHIEVATLWLPKFLSRLVSGDAVGVSAHAAARELMETYDNPCAWGALQIFGDANWTFHEMGSGLARVASFVQSRDS
ncbi:MAG: CHAT domain-containing protein [Syntrophobacteraceae bacterium]